MSDFDKKAAEKLLALKQRRDQLMFRRERAADDLQKKRERLEAVRKEARETFGTDDPKELAVLLRKTRETIAVKLDEYETALDVFESQLKAVEERLAAMDA